MKKLIILFLCIAASSTAVSVKAQGSYDLFGMLAEAEMGNVEAQLEAGKFYAERGNWNKAKEWFELAAQQQDAEAIYWLAKIYDAGVGDTPVDVKKALELFELSAVKGFPKAQLLIGNLYIAGVDTAGVKIVQDVERGIDWIMLAARNGEPEAQLYAGDIYFGGIYVKPADMKTAFDWYLKAANNGNPVAMSRVGVRYLDGDGVTKDLNKALSWLQKAGNNGVDVDMPMGSYYYQIGQRGKAITYYERERNKGGKNGAEGCRMIGSCYASGGIDLAQDLAKALNYWVEAADNGDFYAAVRAGVCYYQGIETAKDYYRAVTYLHNALNLLPATIDSSDKYLVFNAGVASKILSNCYRYGRGTTRNSERETAYGNFAEQCGADEVTVARLVEDITRAYKRE